MALLHVFGFLFFSQLVKRSAENGNRSQGKCPDSFICGNLGSIHFPLTKAERQDCGLLAIHGCDDFLAMKTVQLENKGRWFHVMDIIQHEYNFITIVDKDLNQSLVSRTCDAFKRNFTLPPTTPLVSFRMENVTLFRCNRSLNLTLPKRFFNHTCRDYDVYYAPPALNEDNTHSSLLGCSVLQLPKHLPDSKDLFTFVSGKIYLQVWLSDNCYKCYHRRGGQCQLDSNKNFHCTKDDKRALTGGLALGLGLVSVAVGVGVLFFVIYCYRFKLVGFWKNKSKAHQDFEAFLKSHGPLALRRYSYSDIKQMTNSFKEKLGQGGYGSVFKGKLHDDCLVAVKVLSESKGNGEEFINEVASISRTSHVNIVALLGFCFEGSKRALVYEFMPNGSLEKFIYETSPSMGNHQLNSEILYQIAIGVARGLEYLHRGCNTRILHFDIKPHNILLDENFCPKISDFGLAKICPRKESIVSMLGARGTIGYIAPEVFSRNFGGVSHKSDVYSYGMMVLEIVGGRKNINVEVDHTSEIYFPHWIYKRLELNEEFALRNITNDNDKDMTRKMVIVSLWCIQTDPTDRPTIGRVVEMLEGSVETLQIPPKPFLSSPPRSPPTSSTY